jgi:hypothetical protein
MNCVTCDRLSLIRDGNAAKRNWPACQPAVYASMYYFLRALLWISMNKGYEDYFLARRRWFFGFAALTKSLDVIDTLIKGEAHLRSLGLEYLVATGAFVLLSAVAARTGNPRFHMPFVLSAVAYEISFSIRHFSTLD